MTVKGIAVAYNPYRRLPMKYILMDNCLNRCFSRVFPAIVVRVLLGGRSFSCDVSFVLTMGFRP